MNLIAMPENDFQTLKNELIEIKKLLSSSHQKTNLSEAWLDVQETCLALKISKRTLQTYRDNKVLPFSQIGGKIYFKSTDIEAHLNSHYVKVHNR